MVWLTAWGWPTGNTATARSSPSVVTRSPAVGTGSDTTAASSSPARTASTSSRPAPGSIVVWGTGIVVATRCSARTMPVGSDDWMHPMRSAMLGRSPALRAASRAASACRSTRRASVRSTVPAIRKRHLALGAVKQAHPELVLQLAYLLSNRGLSDVQPLPSATKMQLFGNRYEISEMTKLHGLLAGAYRSICAARLPCNAVTSRRRQTQIRGRGGSRPLGLTQVTGTRGAAAAPSREHRRRIADESVRVCGMASAQSTGPPAPNLSIDAGRGVAISRSSRGASTNGAGVPFLQS